MVTQRHEPLCSVVIATHKRPHLVGRAVASALAFCDALGSGEVVVVDDGGHDGSLELLSQAFAQAEQTGVLRLLAHPENRGVTAAKNTGFAASRGRWVCFLDSDDELLPEQAPQFRKAVEARPEAPLFFFRCKTPEGALVGAPYDTPFAMTLPRYFQDADYGELLTAIRRDIAFEKPYDDDLRGFEGLGCLRIIKRHGAGVVWPAVLRLYYLEHEGRLSSRLSMLLRAKNLARGHARTLLTFWNDLDWPTRLRLSAKATLYAALGAFRPVWTALATISRQKTAH